MASIIRAWVAAHTGLPSLHVSGPGIVWTGNRVVAKLGVGEHLISDPLAPAGTPTKYRIGTSTATLSRHAPGRKWGLVTDSRGRGTVSASWQDDGDSESWESDATRYPSNAVRWPTQRPPAVGGGRLRVYDPADLPALLTVLRRRSSLILGTGAPVAGVEAIRHVLVTSVDHRRLTHKGIRDVTIRWESLPVPSSGLAAPVVTWGEAAALGWRNLSAVGYARAIAGMP